MKAPFIWFGGKRGVSRGYYWERRERPLMILRWRLKCWWRRVRGKPPPNPWEGKRMTVKPDGGLHGRFQ